MMPPVIVALTQAGGALARRIARDLAGAEVHGLAHRVTNADVPFSQAALHLRALFRDGRPIVGVMAAGALVRILAPMLADKHDEPPVLAVAEDGSAVVPLLGGHHGANDLARAIAAALGVSAAITTASDVRFGTAAEPPPGLSNAERTQALAGALAADRPLVAPERTLALGVGCERGADADELAALARAVLADGGQGALACVATIDLKEDEPAIRALADSLDVPLRLFAADALDRETPRVRDASPVVFQAVGTHSVAEAAALAAAGPAATLSVAKRISARCTAALARSPSAIDVAAAGRPCGLLWIVGIGPGAAAWRTPEATMAVAAATDLVGYTLYLDLLGELAAGKARHDYALGQEHARVIEALTLASEGRTVALVSSGDAGIYAMAALVYELIEGREAWRRLAVRVVPGISALQAAAARLGAPLGHDFCAVSLSDLLTPFGVIEQRLAAAAAGDFVTVLYNPASQKRRAPFERALEILRCARPADTPVGIARNLGRPDEAVRIVPLSELAIEMIDMLTVVVIGSSASRKLMSGGADRMYTPRGYAAKGKERTT